MENTIFVGGIPYSGKSYLCKELVSMKPQEYISLGLDDIHDEMGDDAKKFFVALNRFLPDLVNSLELDSNQFDDYDLTPIQNHLKKGLIHQGGEPFWNAMMQQVVNAYIVSELETDKIPVIESLFYNRENRMMFFDSTKEMIDIMQTSIDLDATKKTLVYLDVGMDVAIDRYRGRKNDKPMVNEEVINMVYHSQEIPVSGELPNLDVIVLKNESEVADFIAMNR